MGTILICLLVQESSGEIQATVGDPDLVGVNGRFSGGLTDTISGRIAFDYEDAGGNLEDAVTGRALDDEMDQLAPGSGVGYILNFGEFGPEGGRDRARPRGFAGRKQVGATFTYRF